MSETRQLKNAYVIDVGYRKEQPVALVKMKNEYVIGFGYEIKDNKIDWQYGYYYLTDIKKATTDFKRVLAGENLADTFYKNMDKLDMAQEKIEKENLKRKNKNRNIR